MEERAVEHKMLVFLLGVLALVAVYFISYNAELNSRIVEEEMRAADFQSKLDKVDTVGRAISVYDVTLGKEIYGRKSEEIMPLASLAKTMTILVALHGRDLGGTVNIGDEAVRQVGDHGLFAGEKWNVRDLARITLIASVNDGAYAIAENNKDFITEMNLKAKRIGMEHSFFLNKTGLDINPAQPGAYASALDANLMASYAIRAYPEIFSATTLPEVKINSLSGFSHEFENTNVILDKIPNLVFSKTGFTNLAGGNLTVIFRNSEHHLVAVTILGSTFEDRFSDMEKMVNAINGVL